MGVKNLEDIKNPRLRRYKDKTLMYSFTTLHIPGKNLHLTDAISRNPVSAAEDDKDSLNETLSNVSHRRLAEEEFRTCSWNDMKEAAVLDETCVRLNNVIRLGFPEHISELDSDLKSVWNKKDGLYTLDGVVMYGDRMFVPEKLRGTI